MSVLAPCGPGPRSHSRQRRGDRVGAVVARAVGGGLRSGANRLRSEARRDYLGEAIEAMAASSQFGRGRLGCWGRGLGVVLGPWWRWYRP